MVGLAAALLHFRDPEAIMAILPADHHVRNKDLFNHILGIAHSVAAKEYPGTLGITPTSPATGYGYIQRGEKLPDEFSYPVYQVEGFKEKPDEPTALDMVGTDNFFWNSGMFVWRTELILSEISVQMPILGTGLEQIIAAADSPYLASVVEKVWTTLEPETIDYGIMEHANNVAVVPAAGLGWSDGGSWDSLFDVLTSDQNGYIVFSGSHSLLNTHNSLVYGIGDSGRLVVTIGVDD